MFTLKDLANVFAMDTNIIKRQTDGLKHEDTLLQPPCPGNCLNCILGHIADNRDSMLRALGDKGLMAEEDKKRYGYGSQPVTCDGKDVLRLETLLDIIFKSQKALEERFGTVTEEELKKPGTYAGRDMTLEQRLLFHYFHDAYHTGQTELLRELALKK
jgi:uncharacterized damage-inducible protein DinB